MPRQPLFDFPRDAPSFADLRITPPNKDAFSMIRRVGDWPNSVMCLLGPEKSGLTSAGAAWALENNGTIYAARAIDALTAKQCAKLPVEALVIDGADRVKKSEQLISVINTTMAKGGRLLLTANVPPSKWRIDLEDLSSRLRSIPIAEIYPPDEETLMKRLIASAKTYYLNIPPDVLTYLSTRLTLSYATIEACLSLMSEKVSENERAPSIPMAREVVIALGLEDDA